MQNRLHCLMQLITFGRLALERGALTRQKPLLLLAYLAVEGAKPRRHLAELFFSETSDPLNSLSRALSYLRKEAPNLVKADNTRAWATAESDAVAFMRHADAGELETCTHLYGGAFADDLSIPVSSELEEWVLGTREYFAGRQRDILLRLAEQRAAQGNLTQAAGYAERAYMLSGAPELEPEHFGRVYSLLAVGESPRAAEVREEAEAFGVELNVKVNGLRATFQATEVESPDHNLPLPKSSFVGRDPELLEIAKQLARPECRLLTLHGTGGVGKSRLAVQAAYEAVEARGFKDGIYFVPLDALTSADLIPSSLAEALNLSLQGQEDTLTQVVRHVGDKCALLILDNYEHLIEGATLPATLLEECPNLKVLVTSRERLNLEEEWVLTLGGLTVREGGIGGLEQAQHYDALNLFVQRAKRTRLDFTLTDEDLPHALKICELVEGFPLGIELAAVWVKMLPLAEIASEIEKNVDILAGSSRNALERHQSIQAVFEHSWKLLSAQEQDALKKLSVFVGGFRREAAWEVTGATLLILANLVDKSLLRVTANGRYDRHPLLYQFMQQKFVQDNASQIETQRIYRNYFSIFLERQAEDFSIGASKKALQEIHVELFNILHVAQLAFHIEDKHAFVKILRLLAVDCSYYEARGCPDSTMHILEKAANTAQRIGELNSAQRLYTKLGNLWRGQYGYYLDAHTAYNTALQIARASKDLYSEAVLLSLLGVTKFLLNEIGYEVYLKEAEDVAARSCDSLALSHILQNCSHIAYINNSWEEMESLCKKSLEVLDGISVQSNHILLHSTIRENTFYSLLNLGEAEKKLGKTSASLNSRTQALLLAIEAGNQIWQGYAMHELGEYYHELNNRQLAEEYIAKALEVYRENNISVDIFQLESFAALNGYFLRA
jgi:predicted ATPase